MFYITVQDTVGLYGADTLNMQVWDGERERERGKGGHSDKYSAYAGVRLRKKERGKARERAR